ncbi:MAG: serine hydrolase domain-containing protein [Geminicoccaceae bacterium]
MICATVAAHARLLPDSSMAVVPWWSFTKTLIAACALRLVEDGRLALDSPLATVSYTLRHLLQHRAGVGNYGGLAEYHAAVARGDPPWPVRELLDRIPADRLLFEPGTGWAYSNIGYLLVRKLIEDACGTGLAAALRTRVLAPLGLEETCLAETPKDMNATLFPGGHGYHPGWVYHGTVTGPVGEAALALDRLLGGHLLSPASLAAMLDSYPLGGPLSGRPWRTTGYGLGLMIGTMRVGAGQEVMVAGHSAGGPGSVGAVYRRLDAAGPRTVAAFAEGSDEGSAEHRVTGLLTGPGNDNGP